MTVQLGSDCLRRERERERERERDLFSNLHLDRLWEPASLLSSGYPEQSSHAVNFNTRKIPQNGAYFTMKMDEIFANEAFIQTAIPHRSKPRR
jgi:hypothetical protein